MDELGRDGAPTAAAVFLARAREEAARYGPDPWVCIRELLQNARDAGAHRVVFAVSSEGGQTALRCHDDGEGMSLDHARRYLFTLYASSKDGWRRQAGRFGVGFWSVLRLDPHSVTIASRPRGGAAWQVTFDGTLEDAAHGPSTLPGGTEVVLRWKGEVAGLEAALVDAVRQNGRHLRRRDGAAPLEVIVCGVPVAEPFALPPPSATVARSGLRIAVGLGTAPRVELFSKGLRLRAAARLEDLLSPGRHSDHARVRFPELPGGLAPQALLESDALEPTLSRSDAKDDRALRRLVRRARREIDRLVARQVGLCCPEPMWRRLLARVAAARDAAGDALSISRSAAFVAGAGLVGAAATLLLLWALSDVVPRAGGRAPSSASSTAPAAATSPSSGIILSGAAAGEARPTHAPLRDLARLYHGPDAEVPDPDDPPIALVYTPPDRPVFLAALVVADLDATTPEQVTPAETGATTPYAGPRCDETCTRVSLVAQDRPGLLRLPVDTGSRVDPASVRVDGVAVQPVAAPDGLPAVALPHGQPVTIDYALKHDAGAVWIPRYAAPPPELRARALALAHRPVTERVAALTDLVRERVTYRSDEETAAAHRQAAAAGSPLIARSLAIGAGDCDVQNGVLAALLQTAGVEARLVVGYVGRRGVASPGLHAWVEYRDGALFQIADVSEVAFEEAGGGIGAGRSRRAADAGTGPPPADGPTIAGAAPAPGHAASGARPAVDAGAEAITRPDAGTGDGEGASSLGAGATRAEGRPRLPPRAALPAALLLALVAGAALALRRPRREEHLDAGADLAALVRGVLVRPESFGGGALLHRRILPLLGGDTLSLSAARRLAVSGRLYVASGGSLAGGVRRRSVPVLDAGSDAARVAAEVLGAVDLDGWEDRLASADSPPWCHALEAAAAEAGLGVHILAAPSGGGTRVLNLPAGALEGRRNVQRVIVLDPASPRVAAARVGRERAPASTLFLLADVLAHALELDMAAAERLLVPLAEAALAEASRSEP